jgi:hypothetical protein
MLQGEELLIEGQEPFPYVRHPRRILRFTITNLAIQAGFRSEDIISGDAPKVPMETEIFGSANLEGNYLAVIGLKTEPNTPIHFRLAAPGDTEDHWTARIGFLPADREHRSKAEFFVECYLPPEPIQATLQAIRTNRVPELIVAMNTTLWTTDTLIEWPGKDPYYGPWYLLPEFGEEPRWQQTEHGKIVSLMWREQYGAGT